MESPKEARFSEQEIEELFVDAIHNVDKHISSFQTMDKQLRIKFKKSLDKYIGIVFEEEEQEIKNLQCSAFIGANLMWCLLNDKNQ